MHPYKLLTVGFPVRGSYFGDALETWESDGSEVAYEMSPNVSLESKLKEIPDLFCGEEASSHNLQFRLSSAEIREAITTIFCWYPNAGRYYLSENEELYRPRLLKGLNVRSNIGAAKPRISWRWK
ncbi:hypothetical protein K432DRAFT_53078 [Lepidopterella palustris CBS 459.81]|uniref:Uncharacterized protein n=1 Tax=Lepidopterella palustris CBS 459.81 TaxID=1314670 RepID=A0A8E2EAC4_9PEZI|nr:hypothetical protein K432DRAFT_53078 [Lepidopterella palustris CBS 459.81]